MAITEYQDLGFTSHYKLDKIYETAVFHKFDCRKHKSVISERKGTNGSISTVKPDFSLEVIHGLWPEARVNQKSRAPC